jgi:hypothetical protein
MGFCVKYGRLQNASGIVMCFVTCTIVVEGEKNVSSNGHTFPLTYDKLQQNEWQFIEERNSLKSGLKAFARFQMTKLFAFPFISHEKKKFKNSRAKETFCERNS